MYLKKCIKGNYENKNRSKSVVGISKVPTGTIFCRMFLSPKRNCFHGVHTILVCALAHPTFHLGLLLNTLKYFADPNKSIWGAHSSEIEVLKQPLSKYNWDVNPWLDNKVNLINYYYLHGYGPIKLPNYSIVTFI